MKSGALSIGVGRVGGIAIFVSPVQGGRCVLRNNTRSDGAANTAGNDSLFCPEDHLLRSFVEIAK